MHHSWVEIDRTRLRKNIRAVRGAVSKKTEVIFVVKANAYGHGLIPLAQTAAEEGIRWFAVAYLESAIRLREVLPEANILVLGYTSPTHIALLLQHRIIPIVTDLAHGLALAAAAREHHQVLDVHLKIDTGMGRLGIQWHETAEVAAALQAAEGLRVSGACSHFAKVEPEALDETCAQADRFGTALSHLPPTIFRHLSSSRAALYFPDWDFDGVRQGIDLYGYGATHRAGRFRTEPILQWKSRVAQVKRVPAGFPIGYYSTHKTAVPTQIATVAVGYADGYNRALSNRGNVLIGGKRCAVVGRVSMNWITVDIGPDATVQVDDEVVLIGRQGNQAIWANELSKICRTISYEILTSINASLERVYCD